VGVAYAPDRTNASTGSTAIASARTRTSVGPGAGRGSSPYSTTSGGPRRVMYAARTAYDPAGPTVIEEKVTRAPSSAAAVPSVELAC
jgi:hypothetical protein